MRRAAMVGLMMRHCVNLVVAVVTLADPDSLARPMGKWLLSVLAVWSLFRLLTRSRSNALLAGDYLFVIATCVAIPVVVPDPRFYSFNTAPQAIAGTAVISISVAVSPQVSLPMSVGVAIAYAWGAAAVVGWENLGAVAALYYFVLQWGSASLIRSMLLRVAGAVDRARADRDTAELNQRVSDAVRDYDREQLALLHDTAASTLLMVGNGTSLPQQRLSAQARRDLDLLYEGPWVAQPPRVELVAALRQCAAHLSTPVQFEGRKQVWLDGDTAKPLIAAAREAMNNVDRHARATWLRVTVSPESVTLEDNGIGFDPESPRSGRGVTESIIGRMRRVGGHAHITSAPGSGTVTLLVWASMPTHAWTQAVITDPDRFIERMRAWYGLALTAYAVANAIFAVTYVVMSKRNAMMEATLGTVAVVSTLAAVPGILRGRWQPARFAAVALLLVAIVQPAELPGDLVGGYTHWAQNSIGWCLLPLILGLPVRRGAAVLVMYWIIGAAVELSRNPSTGVWVNIGLGTASILGVQLFALVFNSLMRDAAAEAQEEARAHQRLISRDRVGQALRSEYQRRYAKLVDNVVPLLERLSESGSVDDNLRRLARAECRRLRTLFDQATTFDHPLMQRLRPLVDAAESRQVDVTVDVAGDLPDVAPNDIDAMVRPLASILQLAAMSARLVVTSIGDEISVSIVCDGAASLSAVDAELTPESDDQVDIVTFDDRVWCLVKHRPHSATAGASPPVSTYQTSQGRGPTVGS